MSAFQTHTHCRVWRFVEPGTIPDRRVASLYDEPSNVQLIDRAHYDTLNKRDQDLLMRTRRPMHRKGVPVEYEDIYPELA